MVFVSVIEDYFFLRSWLSLTLKYPNRSQLALEASAKSANSGVVKLCSCLSVVNVPAGFPSTCFQPPSVDEGFAWLVSLSFIIRPKDTFFVIESQVKMLNSRNSGQQFDLLQPFSRLLSPDWILKSLDYSGQSSGQGETRNTEQKLRLYRYIRLLNLTL